MKRACPYVLICGLLISSAIAPSPALAGQTITIKSYIEGDVYGNGTKPRGAKPLSNINQNTVKVLKNGDVVGSAYGNYSASSDTTGNKVNINGGTVQKNVYGGYSVVGKSANNAVNINDGTVYGGGDPAKDGVYGGYGGGAVSGNRVTVSGADTVVNRIVYGG